MYIFNMLESVNSGFLSCLTVFGTTQSRFQKLFRRRVVRREFVTGSANWHKDASRQVKHQNFAYMLRLSDTNRDEKKGTQKKKVVSEHAFGK